MTSQDKKAPDSGLVDDSRAQCEPEVDRKKIPLGENHMIDLSIQEYIALRAEQRTRLDSANKIIHYYTVVLGAVIVGLLSMFKNDNPTLFIPVFHYTMLLVPLVTLPFAFTQQNEELFVRHIGKYFDEMKSQLSSREGLRFWGWEDFHNESIPREMRITGVFRAGLLIFFAALSLILFALTSHPLEWLDNVRLFSASSGAALLFVLDCLLLTTALWTARKMAKRAKQRQNQNT